jgi:ABC-type xylose transport system permease subunit
MKKYILILGDIFTTLIVTMIGFSTHGEAGLSFLSRIAAAFFPLIIAWFLLSPFLGLFQIEITSDPGQLWRPVLAMLFAGPFAAILRGFLLNAPVIPIFAAVLSATSAFGMLVWRGIYFFLNRNKN